MLSGMFCAIRISLVIEYVVCIVFFTDRPDVQISASVRACVWYMLIVNVNKTSSMNIIAIKNIYFHMQAICVVYVLFEG